MKILVVDDEKLLVKGITFNLQNEGYDVEAAYDGVTAVDLARREEYDLIILDWMMPGKSGSEACMEIRTFSGSRRKARESSLLRYGDFTLDMGQRVALRGGRVVDLTAKEYDLLEILMKNPRHVFSREKLMDQVWGYTYAGDYRTVDVHIRRLREKLEPDPAQPQYILTKWGVGYYFQYEDQTAI